MKSGTTQLHYQYLYLLTILLRPIALQVVNKVAVGCEQYPLWSLVSLSESMQSIIGPSPSDGG